MCAIQKNRNIREAHLYIREEADSENHIYKSNSYIAH